MKNVIFGFVALSLTGCSLMISSSGQYSDVLTHGKRREDVIARLGQPVRTVTTNAMYWTEMFDVFQKKGKIYRPMSDFVEIGYLDTFTLFLYEIYGTPKAIIDYNSARNTVHEIEVHYNDEGQYKWHRVTALRHAASSKEVEPNSHKQQSDR